MADNSGPAITLREVQLPNGSTRIQGEFMVVLFVDVDPHQKMIDVDNQVTDSLKAQLTERLKILQGAVGAEMKRMQG